MVGKRIKQIRKEAGLRQKDFADSIRVSAKQVGLWERGQARPSDIYLEKISSIYSVGLEWLKTGTGAKYSVADTAMSPGRVLDFLDRRKEVEHERPGLYSLLADAADEKFFIKEDEMEYLARAELPGNEKTDYLAELGRYRERYKQPSYLLNPEERKIIQFWRTATEEQRREIMDFLEFKAGKNRRK